MTITHRIDDLAAPRLPWPMRALNRTLAPFAGLVSFDETALLSTAMKKSGLTDFGEDGFRKPLRVLVGTLEREARLNPLGRVLTRQMLLQLLTTRLLVQDLVTRHPEILELPVPSPIVILGLPRTGTTCCRETRACGRFPTGRASSRCCRPGSSPRPVGQTRA